MFNKRLGYILVAAGLLAGCGTTNGIAETTDTSELVAASDILMSSEFEVSGSSFEVVKEATQEEVETTNSLETTQQVQESDGTGSAIVVSDDGSSAAEGSWDDDTQTVTSDDQTGEDEQPAEVTPGAVSDYTQCAFYKTSKGKEVIEFTLKNSFATFDVPPVYIKKAMDAKAAQDAYKDLLAKNNCKSEEESAKYRDQVLNTYYDIEGLYSYMVMQSGQSYQPTQQQQQDLQQAQDSGLMQSTGGDGDSGSSDGGYTGEDPAGGINPEDEWGGWEDCGLGGEAR